MLIIKRNKFQNFYNYQFAFYNINYQPEINIFIKLYTSEHST